MREFKGIALSGKAASGKDTIGEALVEAFDLQFQSAEIWKLAGPIYEEAIKTYGMDLNKKDRPLLQRIGTERVARDTSYYPRELVERIRVKHERDTRFLSREIQPSIAIVTDLRKVIEAEYLRYQGFALIRLDVDVFTQRFRLLQRDGDYDPATLVHWTEIDLDHYAYWDMKIPNNGLLTPQEIASFIMRGLGLEISPYADKKKQELRLA